MVLGCQPLGAQTEYETTHQIYINTQTLEILSNIDAVVQGEGTVLNETFFFFFSFSLIQNLQKNDRILLKSHKQTHSDTLSGHQAST